VPFAGLQLLEGETQPELVGKFIRAAKEAGSRFKILKIYGPLDLGRAQFIRFETDCNRSYIRKAAVALKRGYIITDETGKYVATFQGWSGPVSASGMQEVPRPGYKGKAFRGPGDPFWERQFKTGG